MAMGQENEQTVLTRNSTKSGVKRGTGRSFRSACTKRPIVTDRNLVGDDSNDSFQLLSSGLARLLFLKVSSLKWLAPIAILLSSLRKDLLEFSGGAIQGSNCLKGYSGTQA